MIEFPKEFVELPQILEGDLGNRGQAALERLRQRGYQVSSGLNQFYADAIGSICRQAHIREYCPKDASPARFADEASTRNWLRKQGGRAVFLLLSESIEPAQLVGYAWSGLEAEPVDENYPITTAYRLGQAALGRRLGSDFVQTVVSATATMFAKGRGISLETWQSNQPAINIYQKLGFFVLEASQASVEEWRPTLKVSAKAGRVKDRRLYMGYPADLLNDDDSVGADDEV